MQLYNGELARKTEEDIETRPEPVRLKWLLEELMSQDGHTLEAAFVCSVRALPADAEKQMLAETFLSSSPALTTSAVLQHFQDAFRKAAADVCAARNAAELTGTTGNNAIVEAMKTAGRRLAFSCGLELLAPFELDLKSPTLEQQRAKELQQTLLQQQQEGQLKEFQRAAELVKEFNEIRKSAPELSPGDVLKQLSPADQGMILQTLLMASAKEKQTEAVWAVAGPSLVRISPQQSPPQVSVLSIPTSLGPLRSVQPAQGGPMLLVGARSGVIYADPQAPANATCYVDGEVTSLLGFSRAVLWNNEIWACHSEAGIVAWKLDEPEKPFYTLRPAELMGAAPRNLQALGQSQLIFSTNGGLWLFNRTDDGTPVSGGQCQREGGPDVVAVLPETNRLVVVLADGTIQLRDSKTVEVMRQEKRCGAVSSATLLPWLSSTRLLLATEDGPVLGVGLDDDLLTQYLSPYRGMKALAAAADLVAALSEDRQRIILWRSWEPRQPAGDVYVAGVARHRAADLDI